MLTSPSLDSRRSSFLQMAWMSPASARIWMPLGASISSERVGDSSLGGQRSVSAFLTAGLHPGSLQGAAEVDSNPH